MNFKDFMLETHGTPIIYDIKDIDENLIKDIVDKLSFVYRKRVDKYLRPIKVIGNKDANNIEIRINMSNKDILLIEYKDTELKITINGDIKYHIDKIDLNDIAQKIENVYYKHIENQKYKIDKKIF
jgi:hypothetical protein